MWPIIGLGSISCLSVWMYGCTPWTWCTSTLPGHDSNPAECQTGRHLVSFLSSLVRPWQGIRPRSPTSQSQAGNCIHKATDLTVYGMHHWKVVGSSVYQIWLKQYRSLDLYSQTLWHPFPRAMDRHTTTHVRGHSFDFMSCIILEIHVDLDALRQFVKMLMAVMWTHLHYLYFPYTRRTIKTSFDITIWVISSWRRRPYHSMSINNWLASQSRHVTNYNILFRNFLELSMCCLMFTGNLYNNGIITVINAVHVCSSMNILVVYIFSIVV